MKRKVTLKQIAKELDVSISTVSLRNSPEIGEDTRLKYKLLRSFTITDLTTLP
jgi:LacI family transcriptional regulator